MNNFGRNLLVKLSILEKNIKLLLMLLYYYYQYQHIFLDLIMNN